ncbi:Inositol-1,4,5-trisphosphate 5-phosphatase 2, related, related, partial [Eimeria maxima]
MSTYTPHSEMHAADRGYLLTSVVSDIRSTSSLTDISNTCSRSSSRDSSRSSCNNSCTSRSLADTEEVSRDLLLQGAAIQAYESPIHLMPLGKEEEVAHRCCTLDDLQIRQHCTEQEQEQELGDLLVGEAIEELEGKLPVSSDTEMETCSGSPVEELPYHHHHQHQDHHHHYHHLQQQQQEQQQEQQQQQQQQQEQEQQQEQQQKKVLLDNNLLDNNKDCSYPIDESTRVSVLPLFTVVNKTEASGGPPTPSFEWKYEKLQQKLQQHQQQQHHHEQQQEQQQQMQDEEEGGDLALRWECRVVTPCVGLGVDCFSAEGCGVVVCGSPYSLFNNCCNVELPTPFVIRSGSSSSRDSLITPPTDSSGRGGLGAASAGDRKALTHVGHIEEEILLDADDKQAAAHTLGWGKPIKLFVGT